MLCIFKKYEHIFNEHNNINCAVKIEQTILYFLNKVKKLRKIIICNALCYITFETILFYSAH